MNRLLDAVSTNNLKFKMEVIDEGALIEGFQKIANRITLGLLLAAAAGGSWLAISILTGDRPVRHKPPPG
jgi:hypothetical protein